MAPRFCSASFVIRKGLVFARADNGRGLASGLTVAVLSGPPSVRSGPFFLSASLHSKQLHTVTYYYVLLHTVTFCYILHHILLRRAPGA
eukprot:1195177-Prorocentrum_minimum.AAC.3